MRDSFQNYLIKIRAKAGMGANPVIGSYGGRVGKNALKMLIDSLPPDSQFVRLILDWP